MSRLLSSIALLLLALLSLPKVVQADTVLVDQAQFVVGQDTGVQSFTLMSAGTVTVSLTQVPWLDTINSMGGFITSTSGTLGSTFGGSDLFSMTLGPGTYYAHWFGTADGANGVGVERMQISFAGQQTTVPLPGSVLLLLSGLAYLWHLRTSKKEPMVGQLTV